MYYISYPAVSGLVHVTLNLAGICHQVLHSPVLQCCGVWGGEYGLYTEERQQINKKTQWQHGVSSFILFSYDRTRIFIMHPFYCWTYSLCTRWVRRSWVTCSCQAFLTPAAERGVAAGKFPMPPPTDPSGISWLKTEMKIMLKFNFT